METVDEEGLDGCSNGCSNNGGWKRGGTNICVAEWIAVRITVCQTKTEGKDVGKNLGLGLYLKNPTAPH